MILFAFVCYFCHRSIVPIVYFTSSLFFCPVGFFFTPFFFWAILKTNQIQYCIWVYFVFFFLAITLKLIWRYQHTSNASDKSIWLSYELNGKRTQKTLGINPEKKEEEGMSMAQNDSEELRIARLKWSLWIYLRDYSRFGCVCATRRKILAIILSHSHINESFTFLNTIHGTLWPLLIAFPFSHLFFLYFSISHEWCHELLHIRTDKRQTFFFPSCSCSDGRTKNCWTVFRIFVGDNRSVPMRKFYYKSISVYTLIIESIFAPGMTTTVKW